MTIKIKTVCAYGKAEGEVCDTAPCNPLIKLFINGQNVTEKELTPSTFCFDANISFTSKEIPRNAVIKIEVWDDDTSIIGPDLALVQREEGSITSFINEPIRKGAKIPWKFQQPFRRGFQENSIETAIFWENQYKE